MSERHTHLKWFVGKWGHGQHVHIVREASNIEDGLFEYSVQCTEEVMRGGRTAKCRVTGIGEELTAETAKKVTCKKCIRFTGKMVAHAETFAEFGGNIAEWNKKYGRRKPQPAGA